MWLLPMLWGTQALAGDVFVDGVQAQALVEAGAAIIDARGAAAWKKGHVPGSWPMDWLEHRAGRGRSGLLTEDLLSLESALQLAGVQDDNPVLIVGEAGEGWGEEGRWFWTLEYLGHPQVHILDGGWSTWLSAGGPSTRESTSPTPGGFTARVQSGRRATLDEVAAASQTGSALVWDAREAREYRGATPYGEARGGHIPGAAGLWYGDLLASDGSLKPADELRELLLAQGIRPETPIITTCTGGVRSGFAYAVLRELGYPATANYDGSMWEWAADATRPLTNSRSRAPDQ